MTCGSVLVFLLELVSARRVDVPRSVSYLHHPITRLDTIKSQLIDRIVVTWNEGSLAAIAKIFGSTRTEEELAPGPDQIELLMMSERDIEQGNLLSEVEKDELGF